MIKILVSSQPKNPFLDVCQTRFYAFFIFILKFTNKKWKEKKDLLHLRVIQKGFIRLLIRKSLHCLFIFPVLQNVLKFTTVQNIQKNIEYAHFALCTFIPCFIWIFLHRPENKYYSCHFQFIKWFHRTVKSTLNLLSLEQCNNIKIYLKDKKFHFWNVMHLYFLCSSAQNGDFILNVKHDVGYLYKVSYLKSF